ncbi:DUF3857 domain-containing transglutaminase family protein [Adhaeribacter soli]|uniref:DUF3857 domain-containing protein n=1 Tax=Adhaeribacter soli TaxID=2607655 RepID=A0A5N1J7Y9_9BACT|nr:DUF3857 domain-containing transglutaminase family protein [Adhaeribacter soli]KAA9340781.1 DUF3857 domain-containing protein [Adhaeribacter soli]
MLFNILLKIFLIGNLNMVAPPARYQVSAIPEELTRNADAVLRQDELVFTVKDQRNATQKVHYAITILNKNAASYSTLAIPYDKFTKVTNIKGTLYNKDGLIIKHLKNNEIQDIGGISGTSLIEDTRVKAAQFTNASYPVTVEFEYEINSSGLLFYPTWHPQSDYRLAVEQSSFQVNIPAGQVLRYKPVNCPEPEKYKAEKADTYSWTIKQVKAKEKMPWQPSLSELTAKVYTAPTTFEIDGFSGNMTTWKDFGLWVNKLNKDRDKLPEPTIAKLKALTASAPDDQSKVQILYQYLQDNTRYVSIQLGIGGWRPFEASFVDSKGYGDCKALSNYMGAMLRAVGINSFYTLITGGQDEPDLQKDFPSMQFNHVVLCVPLKQDTIWLECTSQTEAMGYGGSFTGNRHALLITPEGGKIVKTPVYSGKDNTVSRKAKIRLESDGNANAELETIYSGLEQDEPAMVSAAGAPDQQAWFYQNVRLSNYSIKHLQYSRTKERIPKVTEKATLIINKCGVTSSKRMFITPNLFNKNTFVFPEDNNRSQDIIQDYASFSSDTLVFALPAGGFHPESLPEQQFIKSAFGEYTSLVKFDGKQLIYIRTLKTEKGRYPGTLYNELREFYHKITAADKAQIVLVSKS